MDKMLSTCLCLGKAGSRMAGFPSRVYSTGTMKPSTARKLRLEATWLGQPALLTWECWHQSQNDPRNACEAPRDPWWRVRRTLLGILGMWKSIEKDSFDGWGRLAGRDKLRPSGSCSQLNCSVRTEEVWKNSTGESFFRTVLLGQLVLLQYTAVKT